MHTGGFFGEIFLAISAEQTMIVSKGEGNFTLRSHMFHKGAPLGAPPHQILPR
jgi:hypothetical protein